MNIPVYSSRSKNIYIDHPYFIDHPGSVIHILYEWLVIFLIKLSNTLLFPIYSFIHSSITIFIDIFSRLFFPQYLLWQTPYLPDITSDMP